MQTQDKAVSLFFAGALDVTVTDASAGEHTPSKAKQIHPHRNVIDCAAGSFTEQKSFAGSLHRLTVSPFCLHTVL